MKQFNYKDITLFKYKKKNGIAIWLLVLAVGFHAMIITPITAYATAIEVSIDSLEIELTDQINNDLSNLDFSSLEDIIENMNSTSTNVFLLDNIQSILSSLISGDTVLSFSDILSSIVGLLSSTIINYLPAFMLIFAIGIMSSIVGKIKGKFSGKSMQNIIHFVCVSLIVIILTTSIQSLATAAGTTIDSVKSQMDIIFPILLTLTTALGGVSSVSVYQPAVAILSSGISTLFTSLVLPLFILMYVFGIIGNLSDNIKLSNFNNFFMSLFKWVVGLVFTFFFAFISIQGISAGSFDSISLRTAKYTIKSYIPFVGSYLSDGLDLILSSSLLIKNAVGVIGVFLIMSSIIIPILNIVIFGLMLKFLSAVLQPLADKKICNILENTSKSLSILITCILVLAFMYVIIIGLVMCTAEVII